MRREGRLDDVATDRVGNGPGTCRIAKRVQRFFQIDFGRGNTGNKNSAAISCCVQQPTSSANLCSQARHCTTSGGAKHETTTVK